MLYLLAVYNKTDSLLSLQIYVKKQSLRPKQPQNPLKSSFLDRYEKENTDLLLLAKPKADISWINHRLHAH